MLHSQFLSEEILLLQLHFTAEYMVFRVTILHQTNYLDLYY